MKKLMYLALIAALVLPVVGCKKKEPTLESVAADAQKLTEEAKKDIEKVKVELPKE